MSLHGSRREWEEITSKQEIKEKRAEKEKE